MAAEPTLTRELLDRWAAKHRPPQSWYESPEEDLTMAAEPFDLEAWLYDRVVGYGDATPKSLAAEIRTHMVERADVATLVEAAKSCDVGQDQESHSDGDWIPIPKWAFKELRAALVAMEQK